MYTYSGIVGYGGVVIQWLQVARLSARDVQCLMGALERVWLDSMSR